VRQITPYPLWIGHAGEARDLPAVLAAGFAALVDLAVDEPPVAVTRELVYCRFPLVDGPDNPPWLLRLAVESVAHLIRTRTPTLVCCGAGMSRAPTIAAAALSIVEGTQADGCLARVTQAHRGFVSPHLWRDITAVLRNGFGV
jgi:hypothetical protein